MFAFHFLVTPCLPLEICPSFLIFLSFCLPYMYSPPSLPPFLHSSLPFSPFIFTQLPPFLSFPPSLLPSLSLSLPLSLCFSFFSAFLASFLLCGRKPLIVELVHVFAISSFQYSFLFYPDVKYFKGIYGGWAVWNGKVKLCIVSVMPNTVCCVCFMFVFLMKTIGQNFSTSDWSNDKSNFLIFGGFRKQ